MITINEKAPVAARAEAEIRAGIETVWNVLTDINRWPEWSPDIKSISLEGDLAEGTTFRWKAGPGTIVSTIQQLEPPTVIAWSGVTTGIRAVHVWRLEQAAGNTIVRTEESWEGLLPGIARWPMRRMLRNTLVGGLGYLKAEAERRMAASSVTGR